MKPQPYFVSPGSAHNRRILLIGYHFAPSTAAGSLRWQKLAGLAAEVANLGVDAVALDPAALRHPDADRYRDLPPGTRAFGVAHPVSWHDRLEAGLLRLYRVLIRSMRQPKCDPTLAQAGVAAVPVRGFVRPPP